MPGVAALTSQPAPPVVAVRVLFLQALTEPHEATQGHLAVMRERGEPIPEPSTVGVATVEAA